MFGVDSEAGALWFPPSHIGIKQLNVCHITASSLSKGCSEGLMKSWGGRRGNPSQKFILTQVHSLDYISAVVKHPSNILRVYCACEMWITVMFTISAGCADSLGKKRKSLSKEAAMQPKQVFL